MREVNVMLAKPKKQHILEELYQKEKDGRKRGVTDRWHNANVVGQINTPAWCNGKGGKGTITVPRMTYDLSHELILDIQDFVTSGEYRTRKVAPERQR